MSAPRIPSASITWQVDRTVPATAGAVREAVARALRDAGFELRTEQLTLIEATRGSQLAVAAMQLSKLPVGASVRIVPSQGGCAVDVMLGDRWRTPIGRVWGLNDRYRQTFAEVSGRLDAAFRRLGADPAAFGPPVFDSKTRDIAPLEAANDVSGKAGAAAADGAERALGGAKPKAPKHLRGLDMVELDAPPGRATLDVGDIAGMITVGGMIATQPGAMPANLAADVERFTARLETEVGGRTGPLVRLELSAGEVPVAQFLREQARIREEVPLRTLQTCRDCRFEKVVNPDYQRLAERNRKLRALGGGVGVVVSPAGVSPFALVGALFRAAKLDPDFVCPRCQGLECDTRIVTFCPTCGERRADAVLRACPKCEHDFRASVPREEMWREIPPEVIVPPPPVLTAGRAPAGPADPADPADPAGATVEIPPGQGAAEVASPGGATGTPPAPPRQEPRAPSVPPAGWHRDPYGRHELRWWTGEGWSEHVMDGSAASTDPPG